MREGIISIHDVRLLSDDCSLEVIATLDAGEVVPGMFVYIPMNISMDLVVKVSGVAPDSERLIRIVLDCEEVPDIVKAFNLENQTLWVLETNDQMPNKWWLPRR